MNRIWLKPIVSNAGAIGLLAILGCGGGSTSAPPPGRSPAPEPTPILSTNTGRAPRQPDVIALYRRMGLLAEGGETPFVGSLSFFAGPTRDSTTIVATVSLANRALRFRAEGDRWRATYDVAIEVRSGTNLVQEHRTREGGGSIGLRLARRTACGGDRHTGAPRQ